MLTNCSGELSLNYADDTMVTGGTWGDITTTANTTATYLAPARFTGTLTDGTGGTAIGLMWFDATAGRFKRNKPLGLAESEYFYALSGERLLGVTSGLARFGLDGGSAFGTVGVLGTIGEGDVFLGFDTGGTIPAKVRLHNVALNGNFIGVVNDGGDRVQLGESGFPVVAADGTVYLGAAADDVIVTRYAGSPEGNVTAAPGSYCADVTNGEGYIKHTGTGNTGWALVTHA
jgi:hypothetical protein